MAEKNKAQRAEDLRDIKMIRTYLTTAMALGIAKVLPGLESKVPELEKQCDAMEGEFIAVLERR